VAQHGIDATGLAIWADALVDDLAAGTGIASQRLAPHLMIRSG
jgi:hypothetical protein